MGGELETWVGTGRVWKCRRVERMSRASSCASCEMIRYRSLPRGWESLDV